MQMIRESIVLLTLFILPFIVSAQLKVGFYRSICPNAESIVRQIVQKRFNTNKSIPAALLRMHFHDCFVRGCDASILIDSTSKQQSEKDAGPNQTVREYKLIDDIKKELERVCPSKVSCADIITLATRDAVLLAGGPKYTVPTGRRDGLVSNINDVDLPGPSMTVSEAFRPFKLRNFTINEFVTLLGAHTVGVTHCSFFSDRLSQPDPTMDPVLASRLSRTCASTTSDPPVSLDQNTSFVFDNEFYKQLLLKRGILQIDQELANDQSTASIVSGFARNLVGFKQNFANAMIKLGGVQVLVGSAGEIRRNCRVFNPKKPTTRPVSSPKTSTPRNGNSKSKSSKKKKPNRGF